MLTKEKAKKLVKEINGEVRGVALKDDLDYILEIKGEQGLERVEQRMAKLGYALKRKDIKSTNFYPMGIGAILSLTIKEVFNFNEKDFEKMGFSEVKFSIFVKIFMKYFSSLKLVAEQVPNMWQRHYTVGELEMPEYSEKEKYIILRVKNFKIEPMYCNLSIGYFSKIAEMLGKGSVTCKETKCMFKGDPYHEFLLTW